MAQQQSLKDAKEQVQYENRVEFLKSEHDRLQKANDLLQADINKKSSDYQLFISMKDSESKKLRADAVAAHEQTEKNKQEFNDVLIAHKADKEAFDLAKQTLERDQRIVAGQKEQISQFIQALRRDLSVLDIEVK